MFFAEPPPTQADLRFRLFGIPVRVHPFFWVVALLLAMGGRGTKLNPLDAVIWVAVVFFSILVHELGHAFMQKRYGGRPWITLYSLGGLASCNDCDRSPTSQIVISLAGPAAGFLLAGAVTAILAASGHLAGFELSLFPVKWIPFDFEHYARTERLSPRDACILYLLQVNILWGLINLLPIYPLDGGRIAREIFTLRRPRPGIIRSLWLSIATAGALAVYGLSQERFFTMVMFALLAYSNYQALRAYQRGYYS